MEIQEGEEGTDSTGDKIYGEINFSALRREFKEVQQFLRVQNWKQVIKHFFIALVFGALGSFVDVGRLCCEEFHLWDELHKAGDEPL